MSLITMPVVIVKFLIKKGRPVNIPQRTLTAVKILKTSSESAKEYSASNIATEEQKSNLNTVSKHKRKKLQASDDVSTKPSLQSLTANFNDINAVFLDYTRIHKQTEYYRDHFIDEFLCLPCQCYYTLFYYIDIL